MKTKLWTGILCLLQLCWAPVVLAQEYTWRATVPAVESRGYYSILLPAAATGHMQPDLSDVRVFSQAGKEVPYVLRREQPVQYTQLFKPYEILHYFRFPNCCSELLIANPDKRKINNISLLIGNADVRKEVKLSGSDNQQDWYVLKERDVLYAIQNKETTAEVKLLDFPLSDYKYFRLQLNDSSSAPLNILKAGYYDTHTESGKYTAIPVAGTIRVDSAEVKKTYITLCFGQPVYAERLELTVQAPQLYYRTGRVLLPAAQQPRRKGLFRRKRAQAAAVVAESFVLSSNAPAQLELPRQQVQELTLEIDNDDNPPLEISAVQALQLNRYLVAQLEPGQVHTLQFGDAAAAAPNYDLQFFRDSLPAHAPVVLAQNISSLAPAAAEKKQTGSTILIWAAIGVVVIGLSYMTVRLLQDMERKKQV